MQMSRIEIQLASKDSPDRTSTAYFDENGIVRWDSNDSVPPKEILEYNIYEGGKIGWDTYRKSEKVRQEELSIFLSNYRKSQQEFWSNPANKEAQEEQIADARGALGPGVTLVDVVSGHKFTT